MAKKIKIAFDPGNRLTTAFDGKKVVNFRSTLGFIYGDNADPELDENSKFVKIIKSEPSPDLNGKQFLLGTAAMYQQRYKKVFELDKMYYALYLLLPCIASLTDGDDVEVELIVNVTDPRRDEPRLIERLRGATEFEVDERNMMVKIPTIRAVNEGLGPWKIAEKKGEIMPDSLTGIINLGGSTADGLLVRSDGKVLEDARFNDEKGGTYALAIDIRKRLREMGRAGADLELDLIMDALETRSDYVGVDVYIGDLIEEAIDDWFTTLQSRIKSYWQPYFRRISKIYATGGSSKLIEDKVKRANRWEMTPDPILDNVKGIYLL